jgi:hypothetical protein
MYAAESFVEGDTEVRFEVSHIQRVTSSAAVICGKGSSNWADVAHRLKAAPHLEGRLTRALSVRLFYKVTTTAGGVIAFSKPTQMASDSEADLPPIQSLFHPSSPAVTPVPCRCIRTRDQSDWEYALCILSA